LFFYFVTKQTLTRPADDGDNDRVMKLATTNHNHTSTHNHHHKQLLAGWKQVQLQNGERMALLPPGQPE
jgi:hypothetical protein